MIRKIIFNSVCSTIFILLIITDLVIADAQRQRQDRLRDNQPRKYRPLQRVHPCEHSSCYPATGNLLIGRENRLYASSTCGIRGPERFCIVSHLEEKKCFLCDTRPETENDPLKNHRIGQIIYVNQPGTLQSTWWQSENGKENVTIQLDLEAEFHFTHLIIVFQTFRPAAMLVERSYDFGRSWHVYRYFAHNCNESFPHAPTTLRNITDVICDSRYSSVEPSKGGEVIFRVLPPNMKIANPYAPHIQNMLKMTNFRINFTKLHNLGDTLLDDRQEIQEKYYYAINNMVIRGSCSCYGHASRCLPLDGLNSNKIDMVHGRCECTHNTKGLNCEECEDFFNDLPWKPALGKQTNACKKCTCNNHATSCHFDYAVYDHSGRISGGVCDNCQHNTQGQHCESCKAFFYRDPNEDIQSPYVCKPCDCDPSGSVDDGICESVSDPDNGLEAGACHCKVNVRGRRCDICKEGFWNLDAKNPKGCENCTCNTFGTINNSGCNMFTGECTCKRFVTGKDCNQCLPETYGLSDQNDGCTPCNCDPGGSLDNFCDVFSGQCKCRPYMTGRTCSQPKQNYFVPQLHTVYEAEADEISQCNAFYPHYGNCTIIPFTPPIDHMPDWTGTGYTRIPENTELEINVRDIPRNMNYDVVLRYLTQTRGDWEDAHITLIRPDEYNPEGPCANSHPSYETRVPFVLPERDTKVVALHDVCLETGKIYKFKIHFERHRHNEDNPGATILIDSLALIPRIEVIPLLSGSAPADNRRREFTHFRCNDSLYDVNYYDVSDPRCKDIFVTVSTFIHDGGKSCNCNTTGTLSNKCDEFGGNCNCKRNVVGRQCDQCAIGTYGFGPEGCKACDCNSVGAKHNYCNLLTGQCECHPNTYGRECDQCYPGFWNFPNCEMCQCNGHAKTCDSRTGRCLHCENFTTGDNCDSCIEGFYGNPLLGSDIGCRPCRCPDTVASGHSHADTCSLDRRNNDMICHCKEGYTGPRCDVCADNFFGSPEKPGGTCEMCNCSNNINLYEVGNCDPKTGKCLKCLYDTAGDSCEFCREGFYGNAFLHDCKPCHCDVLGTNPAIQYCNRTSGQCPCLPNVRGLHCNECEPNHWKIASGEGCEACGCDMKGSYSEQCNRYDGQCECKDGFGGRQCDQCQSDYWGNPNFKCFRCDCNPLGSAKSQCDRETGQCVCHPGMGGFKCDQCARGYIGNPPYCSACGECFDNWDLILKNLENETKDVIGRAEQIKVVGAPGAYTEYFGEMDDKLRYIQQLLDNTTVSMLDIQNLTNRTEELKGKLLASKNRLQQLENASEQVYSNISLATVELDKLRMRSEETKELANQLKENGTQLQEGNDEGALNLTKNALESVNLLSSKKKEAQDYTDKANRQCKRIETMLNISREEFQNSLDENNETISKYRAQLDELKAEIPYLNDDVCDKKGDPCDSVCGGAGCGSCGGVSCEGGAKTIAEKALKVANNTERAIIEKKNNADYMIRSLSQAKANASNAYELAKKSYEISEMYLNRTNNLIHEGNDYIEDLSNIMSNTTASPSEIEDIVNKTLELDLQLDPEKIQVLGQGIQNAVASLENVDKIIADTKQDREHVDSLSMRANETKRKADNILNTVNEVVNALKEAGIAQQEATAATKDAKNDISEAEESLEKIDKDTKDAQIPTNNIAEKVDELYKKLGRLQKNIVRNELDAKDISKQADEVKLSAGLASEKALKLKNQFQNANNSISQKYKETENARDKAQKLLQRASNITVDTNEKLEELKVMTSSYQLKEKRLEDLRKMIDVLNEQVKTYLGTIQTHAERYRICLS